MKIAQKLEARCEEGLKKKVGEENIATNVWEKR